MRKCRFGGVHHRVPLTDSLSPLKGRRFRAEHGGTHSARSGVLGGDVFDLGAIEQLVAKVRVPRPDDAILPSQRRQDNGLYPFGYGL